MTPCVVCRTGLMFAEEIRQSVAMSSEQHDLPHLAKVVEERMRELDLNNETIGRLADGPSTTTMSKIRNIHPTAPSASTLRKLDKALRWRPGSARLVMMGLEPAELPAEWDLPAVIAEIEEADLSATTREAVLRLLRAASQGVKRA